MQTKRLPYKNFCLSLFMLSLLAVLLALPIQALAASTAGPPPGGNIADPVVRAVDIAKPAVVRIITQVSGGLTVNFTQNKAVIFPQGTGKAYSAELSGSGTFISSDGDILTADHVVSPPDQVMQELAAPDVAAYINQHPELGLGQVTADQALQALATGQIKSYANYDLKRSEVFLSTDYSGPLTANKLNDVPQQYHAPVDKIKKESAVDQKDVAIVHAAFKDTPSVQLGDSSTVQQQDQLTIIGFPGNGDVSNRATDLLTSSVNKITVSSIKTTDNGAPVIQVGGNVEHGDSGGPALDNNGRVVGIVSFGLSSNGSPGGTSFLQASASARELVQALLLDTTPGNFQKQWEQSFNDYAATTSGHWGKAAQGFQKLASANPDFKALAKYQTYAEDQAKTEKGTAATPTPHSNNSQGQLSASPLLIVGAVAVVVILGGLLFVSLAWPRRKKKQAAQQIPVPVTDRSGTAPGPRPVVSQGPPGNVQQPHPVSPPRPAPVGAFHDDGMGAFGAPSQTLPALGGQPGPQSTGILRPWPCGHMNRSSARFCTICGEPAPSPPSQPGIRGFEQ